MEKSLKSLNLHIWNGGNFVLTELILVALLFILEGARASMGLSLLCVDVGYKHWSNDMPLFT